MTLDQLLSDAGQGEVIEEIRVQITDLTQSKTSTNKPYYDIEIADGTGRAKLKIWSDSQAFPFLGSIQKGEVIGLDAVFTKNQWGLNAGRPAMRVLSEEERVAFFSPSPERQIVIQRGWDYMVATCTGFQDARLKLLCLETLTRYETKWKRAAAARTYHHARRGGLIEHVSQMMRAAQALAPLYPEISVELLLTGVLFHDIGKLWENDYEAEGFVQPVTLTGELIGHIAAGVEVVNNLWRELRAREEAVFAQGNPSSDLLRQHLLHLILSHHGTREFGSSVTPRTPEGWVLHHVDSIDAKIEMLRCAYAENKELAPGIFEPRRPLEGYPILPIMLSAKKAEGE